ncbi:hypothetical protein KGM_202355 [Danaus plexippus plexippus]|uniref:Uncharacterized protein n=1 Tax=Danaus plexippus plexippus TaxID=278856 RepID=A0A212EV28_DANPL|nr:hypothetical protein KGM_202355 [Danaus plexippus plexippus]
MTSKCQTMAIGVDTSKWKPRSLKGTPAAKAGYIISACLLGSGFMIGAFYQFSGLTRNLRKNIEPIYEDPIEVVERKQLIAIGLPNSCKVVSKYFVKETVMDDSFSDFKEKKKCKIGPKTVQKGKTRQKKPLKPSKGQKDIRSLIKKNEIVSYSKDFNEVCKQSGIDVDAEQLQLAIALSKSLDSFQSSTGSTSEEVEVQDKLSSQERSAKIRSTLQEYGFKLNGSKLPSVNPNKRKKYSKHSKLLRISNEERQTKISDKYAKVLALNCQTVVDISDDNYLRDEIFYKATNISYEHIKNNDVYYVSNLIEKAKHRSCLLRNWSEIPGRPASPELALNDIDFYAIQCTQQEMDEILSSSIDVAQSIIRSKQNCIEEHSNKIVHSNMKLIERGPSNAFSTIHTSHTSPEVIYNELDDSNKVNNRSKLDTNDVQALDVSDHNEVQIVDFNEISGEDKEPEHGEDSIDNNLKVYRSTSPDLFDEECSIVDKNYSIIDNAEKNHTIFMDLTESENNLNTQKLESTKNNSNNIIEIIDCVDYNAHKDKDKRKSIDLKDRTGSANRNTDIGNNIDHVLSDNDENSEMIDLTQEPNLIDELPSIDLGNKNTSVELDDTIIYENHEQVTSEPTNEAISKSNQITDFNIQCNGDIRDVIGITNGNIQGVDASDICDGDVENCELVNIDLTQSSREGVGNCSNRELVDEHAENVNASDSDVSIYSVKGLSLDNNLGNGIDVNDTLTLDSDNDNDNNGYREQQVYH